MTRTGSDRPSFFSVTPATVRYDTELSSSAKMLYGEITALAAKKGFCWATNTYFAELYQVHPVTISEWVSQLARRGHITVRQLKDGRRIHLPGTAKTLRGLSQKAKHSNTGSISSSNTTTASSPTPQEFSLSDEIEKLESSSRRDLNIIAFFITEKGLKPQNAGQLRTVIKRHIRAASMLKDYSDKELVEAAKKASQFPEWTLETVVKTLTR